MKNSTLFRPKSFTQLRFLTRGALPLLSRFFARSTRRRSFTAFEGVFDAPKAKRPSFSNSFLLSNPPCRTKYVLTSPPAFLFFFFFLVLVSRHGFYLFSMSKLPILVFSPLLPSLCVSGILTGVTLDRSLFFPPPARFEFFPRCACRSSSFARFCVFLDRTMGRIRRTSSLPSPRASQFFFLLRQTDCH